MATVSPQARESDPPYRTHAVFNQATPLAASHSGWQTLTVQATPPPNATMFQVHLQTWSNTGTAYFDNVSIHES